MLMKLLSIGPILAVVCSTCLADEPTFPKFERIVIDDDFPGGYQVEVADVNGDKKPDIVALGGSTLAWYENPSWKKRIVSTAKQTPDIISSATADLDGDGKAEIAIAYDFSMNEPKRGKLLLATQGAKSDDPWTFTPVVSARPGLPVGGGLAGPGGGGFAGGGGAGGQVQEPADKLPSIQRLRWGIIPSIIPTTDIPPARAITIKKKAGLFVAPIFGPMVRPPAFGEQPARLIVYQPGFDPKSGRWWDMTVGEVPVLHAIEVIDLETSGGLSSVLGASNLGVTEFRIIGFGMGSPYRGNTLAPRRPRRRPQEGGQRGPPRQAQGGPEVRCHGRALARHGCRHLRGGGRTTRDHEGVLQARPSGRNRRHDEGRPRPLGGRLRRRRRR